MDCPVERPQPKQGAHIRPGASEYLSMSVDGYRRAAKPDCWSLGDYDPNDPEEAALLEEGRSRRARACYRGSAGSSGERASCAPCQRSRIHSVLRGLSTQKKTR